MDKLGCRNWELRGGTHEIINRVKDQRKTTKSMGIRNSLAKNINCSKEKDWDMTKYGEKSAFD